MRWTAPLLGFLVFMITSAGVSVAFEVQTYAHVNIVPGVIVSETTGASFLASATGSGGDRDSEPVDQVVPGDQLVFDLSGPADLHVIAQLTEVFDFYSDAVSPGGRAVSAPADLIHGSDGDLHLDFALGCGSNADEARPRRLHLLLQYE